MRYLFLIAFLLMISCNESTGPDSKLLNYWYLEGAYIISPTYGMVNQTPDVGHIIYISEDSLYTYVAYGTEWSGMTISEGWFDSTKITVQLITCTEDEIMNSSDNSKIYDYSINSGKLEFSSSVQYAAGQQVETGTLKQIYVAYTGIFPPEEWPPLEQGDIEIND